MSVTEPMANNSSKEEKVQISKIEKELGDPKLFEGIPVKKRYFRKFSGSALFLIWV